MHLLEGVAGRLSREFTCNRRLKNNWNVVAESLDTLKTLKRKYRFGIIVMGHHEVLSCKTEQDCVTVAENIIRRAEDVVKNACETVYVCKIPTVPTHDTNHKKIRNPVQEQFEICNRILEQLVNKRTDGSLLRGALLDSFEYHWRRDCYVDDNYLESYGGIHYYSSRGYDRMAQELYELMLPLVLKDDLMSKSVKSD